MSLRSLGLISAACFAAHATNRALAGDAWSLLWACHVASLLIAAGLLTRHRPLTQVGVLWLCLGNLLWVTDLLMGEPLRPTSALTHLGAAACGLIGARRMGGWGPVPWLWLYALIGGQALIALSRLITPPAENVNLAFAVHGGSSALFTSFTAYHALMAAFAGATFWVSDQALRRALPPKTPAPSAGRG